MIARGLSAFVRRCVVQGPVVRLSSPAAAVQLPVRQAPLVLEPRIPPKKNHIDAEMHTPSPFLRTPHECTDEKNVRRKKKNEMRTNGKQTIPF